jgi:hypothetical protein
MTKYIYILAVSMILDLVMGDEIIYTKELLSTLDKLKINDQYDS